MRHHFGLRRIVKKFVKMEIVMFSPANAQCVWRSGYLKQLLKLAVIFTSLLVFTSCNDDDDDRSVQPNGPNPEWAPDIDPDMLTVIEQLQEFGVPPITELSVEQARNAPSATDAVEMVMKKNNITPRNYAVDIAHRTITGPSQEGIFVRVYTPSEMMGPYPVIVYYHGGGWVIGNLDEYEPSAIALADMADAIVISVADSPWISLVNARDVSNLPSATIITAQIDPLMSEGQQYAEKLEQAGVDVLYQNFDGVTHEFFGMATVVRDAQQAQRIVTERLINIFQSR